MNNIEGEVTPGFKLRHTLRGHEGQVTCLAWSPDGQFLASASVDGTVRLWDARMGEEQRLLDVRRAPAVSITWSPTGPLLCVAYANRALLLWDVATGALQKRVSGHRASVNQVSWSPDGHWVASGSDDKTVRLWDVREFNNALTLRGHRGPVSGVTWSPDALLLASGSEDATVIVWDAERQKILRSLEGHQYPVSSVIWSPDGRALASNDASGRGLLWDAAAGTAREIPTREGGATYLTFSPDGLLLACRSQAGMQFLRYDTLEEMAFLEDALPTTLRPIAAFQPNIPAFATASVDEKAINVWDYDPEAILGAAPISLSKTYTSAKVILVGDTGVGKSGLALRLAEGRFAATESTHGMQVWRLESGGDGPADGPAAEREILLWDLAGQPDYRLIHQLFLDDVALGVVVFDPTRQGNPFQAADYWNKALQQGARDSCPRLLVAGRVDVGVPTLTRHDMMEYCQKHGFAEFIATSAKTGEGVSQLRDAIERHISWNELTRTTAPALWVELRQYLLRRRGAGDVLALRGDLLSMFRHKYPQVKIEDESLDAVLEYMQTLGLIWLLPPGDLVLLQPERLNDYASAVIIAARNHPDGLGSIPLQRVLAGEFGFAGARRVSDSGAERSLLSAVVELLLRRELALLEGEHLIFPSVMNRKLPALPDLPRGEVTYHFSGNVEEIYSRLVVRLSYSGAFELKELWKNAVEFLDLAAFNCGLWVETTGEGLGRITAFFAADTSLHSKTLFLRYVDDHLSKHARADSVRRERVYRCPNCGEEAGDWRAVEIRLARGKSDIRCQYCETPISLIDQLEAGMRDEGVARDLVELERAVERKKERVLNITAGRLDNSVFDVFMCYSFEDRVQVQELGEQLKERGIRPWLDMWEIKAGDNWLDRIEEALGQIKTAAVFVAGGRFPWRQHDVTLLLKEFARRDREIIPVALPGSKTLRPKLPPFLAGKSWIDYRARDKDALDQLVWRITGTRYRRAGGGS